MGKEAKFLDEAPVDIGKPVERTSSSPRIEFLDSIRGLAALAVLLSHAAGVLVAPAFFFYVLHIPLLNAGFDGKAAVAMFFLLSGLVLSRPYLKINATT